MWKKLLRHKAFLAAGAGLATVLAFPPIEIIPLVLVAGVLLAALVQRSDGFRDGFKWGFVASLVIMWGGFYWVVYVLHEFGHLPWAAAAALYLAFCGLGALNFPLFVGLGAFLGRRLRDSRPGLRLAWLTFGLPALFVTLEYLVPKLFPWYVGHALYRQVWLTQIVELTGSPVLSFGILSWGSALWALFTRDEKDSPSSAVKLLALPALLTIGSIAFSAVRLQEHRTRADGRTLRVAAVQANIGSLEKVQARKGIHSQVRYTVDQYHSLTERALAEEAPPELVVWPETAMPFFLLGGAPYAREARRTVSEWGIPVITGGYAPYRSAIRQDYNAAYLLDPKQSLEDPQVYHKNILLAYGEYMPFGDTFPTLYRWFPAVSNFMNGTTQPVFTLADGTRVGVTVCYEAIVPEFFRKITSQGVHFVVNLTNDSWFGPTSEPYQHAALSTFRAIESRVPLVRVTNTGVTFFVDAVGRTSRTIGVGAEGHLLETIRLPATPPRTLYVAWGDWFVFACMLGLIVVLLWGKANASLPFRLGNRGTPP